MTISELTPGRDEAQLRAKSEQGRQAAEVLSNPAYQAGWKALQDSIADAWRKCAVGDTDTMELLHSQARLLGNLQNLLGQAINGGKAAQHDLEEAARQLAEAERNKRFMDRGMRAVGLRRQ